MDQNERLQKILANLEKSTGIKVDVQVPTETLEDQVAEAQSVLNYFSTKVGYTREICKNCKKEFLYSWYIAGVKCCSITCYQEELKKIGLQWDPMKPSSERWQRARPAIISSHATELIDEIEAIVAETE